LRFLIANPALREAAGRAARRRIEDHYQWQKVAEDIESAYLEILRKDSATVLEKKPSNTAAITGEDLPLRRRAG
jgi:hypothetical protein